MHIFAVELWDEWMAFPVQDADDESGSAELAGLLAALPFEKDESSGRASLGTSRLWSLRRLTKLWKNSRWNGEWNIAASISVPSNMKGRVELALPLKLYEAASAPAVYDWAWARGAWGGCGALYVPKSGYYLVMRAGSEALVSRLTQILHKARISWSERTRGKHEIILRDQEGIVAFLSKIGLTEVSLRLEDKAIMRSMRDQANRVRNCDTANINKTLKAAEEQTKLALELQRGGFVETLPQHFRALVEARLEHPEESLSDLGKRLSPPVTKSTVKYRWQRLQDYCHNDLLKELKEGISQ